MERQCEMTSFRILKLADIEGRRGRMTDIVITSLDNQKAGKARGKLIWIYIYIIFLLITGS